MSANVTTIIFGNNIAVGTSSIIPQGAFLRPFGSKRPQVGNAAIAGEEFLGQLLYHCQKGCLPRGKHPFIQLL